MKKITLFMGLLVYVLSITGCNSKIFMPYEDEPLCKAGKESGYCGSVSEVYEYKMREGK
mgnify:FL=1